MTNHFLCKLSGVQQSEVQQHTSFQISRPFTTRTSYVFCLTKMSSYPALPTTAARESNTNTVIVGSLLTRPFAETIFHWQPKFLESNIFHILCLNIRKVIAGPSGKITNGFGEQMGHEPRCHQFSTLECTNSVFRPGLRPGPLWKSSRRPPDPLVGNSVALRLRHSIGRCLRRPSRRALLRNGISWIRHMHGQNRRT